MHNQKQKNLTEVIIMVEEEKLFSLKINTPKINIELNGSNEYIEKMFNLISSEFLVQQEIIGLIDEDEEDEDLNEEELEEIEKIEKEPTSISLDEFQKDYKFEKQQEKFIITALWLTKVKKVIDLSSAVINKVLDDNGFKKIDHITTRFNALRNKGMLTIVRAPSHQRKIFKLTREDIDKIEKTYKLDKEK